jgi:hypothetical protein
MFVPRHWPRDSANTICIHRLFGGAVASLLSARFFCEHCQKETHFLPIHFAVALTGVSRSTVYYWMDRRWVHWRELPSRRRVICKESLSCQARDEDSLLVETIRPKVSDCVQSRKLTGN